MQAAVSVVLHVCHFQRIFYRTGLCRLCQCNDRYKLFILPNLLQQRGIYNTRKVGSITVLKQDAHGNALPGAVFLLERSTDGGTAWERIAEQSSDSGGAAVFSELSISGVYRVTEIKAPAGHTLQAGMLFEGELGDSGSYDISFISCDCTIMTLPFTGEYGFRYIQFAALMLCMSLFIISKTKKENPE